MASDEIEKLRTERYQLELDIRREELRQKQEESRQPAKPKNKLTVEQATILVAVIGFIGSFLGNFLQGYYAQVQKKDEFQSNLITKAVETGNSDQSKRNLKFLLDVGLINDPGNKIKNIVADSTYEIKFLSAINLTDSVKKSDLEYIVSEICNAIGVRQNFVLVPEENIGIVAAKNIDGKRIIAYDPKAVQGARTAAGTNWSVVTMFAHECAHHLMGHILEKDLALEQNRQYELDADNAAGFVVAKMGASLSETQSAYQKLPLSEDSTGPYPAKSLRIRAVSNGWNRGQRKRDVQ